MTFLTSLGIGPAEIHRLAESVQKLETFEVNGSLSVGHDVALRDVLDALCEADPPRGSLEMTTRDRREVPRDDYISRKSDSLDPALLENMIMEGATLMVTALATWADEFNEYPVRDHAFRLEVNMFMSGPLCQAYPAHFDLLDAIIIQLVGNKGWQLWPTLSAESAQRQSAHPQFGQPATSAMLSVGDVLLMPSYTPHLVASTFSPSVHVAVAIRQHGPR